MFYVKVIWLYMLLNLVHVPLQPTHLTFYSDIQCDLPSCCARSWEVAALTQLHVSAFTPNSQRPEFAFTPDYTTLHILAIVSILNLSIWQYTDYVLVATGVYNCVMCAFVNCIRHLSVYITSLK